MEGVYAGLGALVVVGVAILMSYNWFVQQRKRISESWAIVEAELQRRYDLIPRLVETVKAFAAHERYILDRVVETRAVAARTSGDPAHQAAAERPLVAAMRQLMAVVESYPALRSSDGFVSLHSELARTDDRLAAARRFFNGNVRDFNRRVQAFPSNLIAAAFGFVESEYFEVAEVLRRSGSPHVDMGRRR